MLFSGGGNKSKAVELEDVKFHQCVRLSRFENDRTISFIPPDGEFELMSYRLNTQVKPLIWVEPVVERFSHSRVEYMVKAKSQFKKRSTANNVEITTLALPDGKVGVVKQGLELKIQRNILAKYKDEEEKVVSDLIKKRKEFEQRISVCKERYSIIIKLGYYFPSYSPFDFIFF